MRALAMLALVTVQACGSDSSSSANDGNDDFVSAEEVTLALFSESVSPPTPPLPPRPPELGAVRTSEDRDRYLALGDGTVLHLNVYRGLEILDLADPSRPAVIGRLPVMGEPVAIYADEGRAVLLLNQVRAFQGLPGAPIPAAHYGALVLLVDISDRQAPTVGDHLFLPATIQGSGFRTGGGDSDSLLFLVANRQASRTGPEEGIVQGIALQGTQLALRRELVLSIPVSVVQATPDVLLLAANESSRFSTSAQISLIDITDPTGSIRLRGAVSLDGLVPSRHRMDLTNNILRIALDAGIREPSRLQTWNATNLDELTLVDEASLTGEYLIGSVFVDDRAFIKDTDVLGGATFKAFTIDATGQITEISEPGLIQDYELFRPVLDSTRILGITGPFPMLAVNLYNLQSAPDSISFMAGSELTDGQEPWRWSDAVLDIYDVAVLENAISVTAPSGEIETGVVLVQFYAFHDTGERRTGVQVFTFSEATVTRRGTMLHENDVRLSATVTQGITANFSDTALSVFDDTDLNAPAARGHLELAPSYTALLSYGDYRARLSPIPTADRGAAVDIIRKSDNPELAAAVATLLVPRGAGILKLGSLLLVVAGEPAEGGADPVTRIQVYDLTDPQDPVQRGELATSELGSVVPPEDCPSCWWRPQADFLPAHVVGTTLVFADVEVEALPESGKRVCAEIVSGTEDCIAQRSCTYVVGTSECYQPDTSDEYCVGSFAECRSDGVSEPTCTRRARNEIASQVGDMCTLITETRTQRALTLRMVDLSDPAQPALLPPIALPDSYEPVHVDVDVDVDESRLYVAVKQQVEAAFSNHPHAKHYVLPIDLSNPAQPAQEPMIYVPGELVAVRGNRFYTHHRAWNAGEIESSIKLVEVEEGQARVAHSHAVPNRTVFGVAVNDAGQVLVSHSSVWRKYDRRFSGRFFSQLTILSPEDAGLTVSVAGVNVTHAADFILPVGGRALLQTGGGALIMNVDTVALPTLEAFFPLAGLAQNLLLDGDELLVPAGRYGIYRLGPGERNILPAE